LKQVILKTWRTKTSPPIKRDTGFCSKIIFLKASLVFWNYISRGNEHNSIVRGITGSRMNLLKRCLLPRTSEQFIG
jgi:hypothetical protein